VELIYFVLACWGLSQAILYGSIFDKIRPSREWLYGFGKLFHCPMCVGFHIGWFLFVINGFTELFNFEYTVANFFICGWVSSATTYSLVNLFGDSGFNIFYTKEVSNDTEYTGHL
jgi:hypothetical protein